MWLGTNLTTFKNNLLLLSSEQICLSRLSTESHILTPWRWRQYHTCVKKSVHFYQVHGATTPMRVAFMAAAVRTSYLISELVCTKNWRNYLGSKNKTQCHNYVAINIPVRRKTNTCPIFIILYNESANAVSVTKPLLCCPVLWHCSLIRATAFCTARFEITPQANAKQLQPSGAQEIPRRFRSKKVHCCVHKNQPQEIITTYLNQDYCFL